MPAALSVDKSLTLARQAAKKQDWITAYRNYKAVLNRFPSNKKAAKAVAELSKVAAPALLKRAKVEQDNGDWKAVNDLLRAAAFFAPGVVEIRTVLAESYIESGNPSAGLPIIDKLLAAEPNSALFHRIRGQALHELDRPDEAKKALRKALEIDPSYAKAHRAIGIVARSQGDLDEALSHFEAGLDITPNDANLYRHVVTLAPPKNDQDPHIVKLKGALAALGADNPKSIPLHLALFEALHKSGNREAAFSHLSKAKAVVSQQHPYDFQSDAVVAAFSKAQFSDAEWFQQEVKAPRLIFVTGLPRSGTTLTERILSCADDVQACGEQMIVQRAVIDLLGDVRQRKDPKLNHQDIAGLRESLLAAYAKISDGRSVQIDKMPLNFRWIGYLVAALPEARIVHLNRDPQAVAWSLYRHLFKGRGHDFMHSPEDIARFMILHRDLMAHWRKVCGARVFDLSYSELVNDQVTATKALADAVDLDWSDAWLSPEKATNHVRTSSVLQVTKPIYKNSDESWRVYESQLAPLTAALGQAGLISPEKVS
ncbi:tetratricopeptide repeat-containing sulfotransferase family protein [Cognatishimia activa]|uniref:Tetratricopeptide repeat protein n=1 Tax=Cognatishimia activa TaxID=1715691 RepID=A0A0P1IMX0_9RHOB|nr:sulfotransferase [Cognatishimia activa]CUJ13773.1 tetratricopeptide repeat protein [Cognatishimia activa]CUK24972.1 tetratricopeptide repeat protein [Cognatishimia activa]